MIIRKFIALISSLLLLQACSHPLEIIGEGDIVDLNGSGHGCTLEQFQSRDEACTENMVVYEYNVNYQAVPRPGWQFVRWDGPCSGNSIAPNCSWNVSAEEVKKYWTKVMPATVAVFSPITLSWYKDTDGDSYGDPLTEFIGDKPDNSYVSDNSDCDDSNSSVNPAGVETGTADLIDSNCDGEVDPGFKYVFVSSNSYSGDLIASAPIVTNDGLQAADAICQQLADQAVPALPGTYAAWLSSESVNARDRVTAEPQNTFSYVLPDAPRSVIAVGFPGLVDGVLDHAINTDQSGTELVLRFVWTGSRYDGVRAGGQCDNWSQSSSQLLGYAGVSVDFDSEWSWWDQASCDQELHLYCFQR